MTFLSVKYFTKMNVITNTNISTDWAVSFVVGRAIFKIPNLNFSNKCAVQSIVGLLKVKPSAPPCGGGSTWGGNDRWQHSCNMHLAMGTKSTFSLFFLPCFTDY